jgi:hypothetical protein
LTARPSEVPTREQIERAKKFGPSYFQCTEGGYAAFQALCDLALSALDQEYPFNCKEEGKPCQRWCGANPCLAETQQAPGKAAEWIGRTLLDVDSYCPSCGHNRDESSVSSIDNEDGTHSCQQCGADWREQITTPPAPQSEGGEVVSEKPDDIVGHKTFRYGKGGFRHEPLTRAEGDALRKRAEEVYQARREKYPDEQTCVTAIFDACLRLEELGWKRAYLAPADRKLRKTISLGSTGIHDAYCEPRTQHPIQMGNWWWHPSEGDLWPHEPIYFKERAND